MSEFVIEAASAEKLRHESGLGVEQFLASLVPSTANLARPPISKFHVGAVGLGYSGRVFRGVNVEFKGLPLNHCVHAEQFLVANALQHGEKKLVFIAVSAAPCGHCRQFLQELRDAGKIKILITDGKDAQVRPLSYFLPHRFGPEDLLSKDFPLLLEPRLNGLKASGSSSISQNGKKCSNSNLSESKNGESAEENATKAMELAPSEPALSKETSLNSWLDAGKPPISELEKRACAAANASYAPYSRCPSGISIATKMGAIFSGSYMESAAYNPGLPPLQAAIVAFICGGGGSYDQILTVVLVEMKGAVVQHAATVRLALEKISPDASFHVHEVDP